MNVLIVAKGKALLALLAGKLEQAQIVERICNVASFQRARSLDVNIYLAVYVSLENHLAFIKILSWDWVMEKSLNPIY